MKRLAPKIIFVAAVLPLFLGVTPKALAQTTSSGATTTIIPPSFELFANPGDTLQEKISVRNETGQELVYNISTEDFEAQGDNGDVQLVKTDPARTYSLSQWITPSENSIDVPAHTEKDLNFSIAVPQGAEPGGHYGAISISTQSGSNAGAANVSAAQVSLILLRVSGAITEKATVESFTAPSYSEYGPIPFTLKIKNEGNVHVKPQGTIVITDLFGAKVAEIPFSGSNDLPGAERVMVDDWSSKNPIGRFTATLIANYGEKNEPMLATTHFTVFPKPLAIGAGIAVLALILLVIFGISGRKRIAKALKVIAQG